MSLRLALVTSQEADQFVFSHAADGGLLQSSEWLAFQRNLGNPARTFALVSGNELVVFANAVVLDLGLRQRVLYVPRGPVVLPTVVGGGRTSALAHVLARLTLALSEWGKREGATMLRIDPAWEVPCVELERGLVRSGWHYVARHVQPKETLRVNLWDDEAKLMGAMKGKTRYNIHLAQRRGVQITHSRNIAHFIDLLLATAKRQHFAIHPPQYYRALIAHVGSASLYLAHLNGELLAGALVASTPSTLWYLHGASSHQGREAMAPYLLHWELIREASRQGKTWYDFGGVSTNTGHAWEGVTRFKRSFAPKTPITTYTGTWEYPLKLLTYTAYRVWTKLH